MRMLVKRWKSESPKIFKAITKICIALGAIGAGIMAAENALPNYAGAIAPHFLVAGIVGGVISKITVSDPESLQEQ